MVSNEHLANDSACGPVVGSRVTDVIDFLSGLQEI